MRATTAATAEGAEEVLNGVALARDVVTVLERISEVADETTTAAREISNASQQQKHASAEVASAMGDVVGVSEQTAVRLPRGCPRRGVADLAGRRPARVDLPLPHLTPPWLSPGTDGVPSVAPLTE